MILRSLFACFQKQTLSLLLPFLTVFGDLAPNTLFIKWFMCVKSNENFPGEESVLIMYNYYGKGHYEGKVSVSSSF